MISGYKVFEIFILQPVLPFDGLMLRLSARNEYSCPLQMLSIAAEEGDNMSGLS